MKALGDYRPRPRVVGVARRTIPRIAITGLVGQQILRFSVSSMTASSHADQSEETFLDLLESDNRRLALQSSAYIQLMEKTGRFRRVESLTVNASDQESSRAGLTSKA